MRKKIQLATGWQLKLGFTLVELLVVMSIISVLATLAVGSYMSAQTKGRDSRRKQDIYQITNALELYNNDYSAYPASTGDKIAGCPTTTSTPCSWGEGSFTDGQTVYMKQVPADPSSRYEYRYEVSSDQQKYKIFAKIENLQDPDIFANLIQLCGAANCNFGVTSPNTALTESF